MFYNKNIEKLKKHKDVFLLKKNKNMFYNYGFSVYFCSEYCVRI